MHNLQLTRGQSSPANLQSGQHPSKATLWNRSKIVMWFATTTCKCHKCRHWRATSKQPPQTMTCEISDGPGATFSCTALTSYFECSIRESGQGSRIICTWWILWGWSCFPLPKPLLASYSPLPPPYQLPSGPRTSVGCSEINTSSHPFSIWGATTFSSENFLQK